MYNKKITVGIIAEYNPFHNGHLLQITKVRESYPEANIIVVMSGNFVQRGQVALLDKWQRAQLAIQNGVDLVFELPFSFACRSAQYFAQGAVYLLNSLGMVDYLAFGAECADLEMLESIAVRSIQPETITTLKSYMKQGYSYPRALAASIGTDIAPGVIDAPNNILAIEYLKQIHMQNSNIKPLLILRTGSGYNDNTIYGNIASAGAIRTHLQNCGLDEHICRVIPDVTYKAIESAIADNRLILSDDKLSLLAIYKLRNISPEYLQEHCDVSEGLEYKIIKSAQTSCDISQLIGKLVDSRYHKGRICRIIMQALVGMNKVEQPSYLRLLAASKCGTALLSVIKKHSSLSLVVRLGKGFKYLDTNLQSCQCLQTDIAAANIYQLLYDKCEIHNKDFYQSPIIMKN